MRALLPCLGANWKGVRAQCNPLPERALQEVVARIEQPGHRADIRAVALSADDQLLMSASNSAVKVCNGSLQECWERAGGATVVWESGVVREGPAADVSRLVVSV